MFMHCGFSVVSHLVLLFSLSMNNLHFHLWPQSELDETLKTGVVHCFWTGAKAKYILG